MRRVGGMSVLAAVAVALSACGGGDGEFSVSGALERLPDPGRSVPVLVSVGDLETAAQHLGIDRDAADDDGTRLSLRLSASLNDGDGDVFVPFPGHIRDFPELAEELGWGYDDVAAYAELAPMDGGPPTFIAAFEPREGALLGTDAMTDEGAGVFKIGEGEEGRYDFANTTPLRPLGAPWYAAVDDDWTYVADRVAMVDAARDGPDSLGDDEVLATIAELLDDRDAYAAVLIARHSFALEYRPPLTSDIDQAMEYLEQQRADAIERPFASVGMGWAFDDGTPVTVIVYDFGSESAAQSSVEDVRHVWTEGQLTTGRAVSQLATVRSVEADGSALVLVLEHPGPNGAPAVFQMLTAQREIVFAHT